MGCAWCWSLHWGQLAKQSWNYTVKFSYSLKQSVCVKAGWYQPQWPLKGCCYYYLMWQERGILQRMVQTLNWATVKIRRKSCSSNQWHDSLHRNFSSEGTQNKLLCINGHLWFVLCLRMKLLSKMLEGEKKCIAKGYGILRQRWRGKRNIF